MPSLHQTLLALQKELTGAAGRGLLAGNGRIHLSLCFSLPPANSTSPEAACAFQIAEPASGSFGGNEPCHRLELDLEWVDGQLRFPSSPAVIHEPGPSTTPLPAREPEATDQQPPAEVLEGLTRFLGAPGFDSAARATVFREVLEPLSSESLLRVIQCLDGAPHPELEGEIKHAWHRFSGLIRSRGFKSVAEGSRVLGSLFKSHSKHQILGWTQRTWKTQEEWCS
ncbi:MAG: hypothetical protein FJ405_01475 [Verrucomicrobia bacterium]|nr:hypothetical protein [Verrucomicrobiota bacterium]